ncbi:flavin reductase family protein [Streptomyces griseorubiginosus]|uniref:flavin reductase family protein n=1 Tax=Streptomyces griseorubiginosus TaxID=67304 RepID=UPI001AD653C4|nr:flavin reductase family protein [Streptomyces griseorubiginosus]MBO4253329.1 flavin reductase [Streptomyces griseorubiginosus]
MTTPTADSLQSAFRETMAVVCTPVAVVTTRWQGLPYGTTVSAFTSLSMEPPMVLVSLDRRSQLLTALRASGTFGVNILGSAQAAVAAHFARKGGTGKFADVAWLDDSGLPRLPDVTGFVNCRVASLVDGGDHLVVLGEVMAADSTASPPLTYHNREFGTHVGFERGS